MDTVKDCDTCALHTQTVLAPECGDCMRSTQDLPYWRPKMATKINSCHTCLYELMPGTSSECIDCTLTNDNWKPKAVVVPAPKASDGSTADYYVLPNGATELQDIIAAHNMNAQMGEIGRAWMRYGRCPHSPKQRELKKIIFYAQAELDRLEKYGD